MKTHDGPVLFFFFAQAIVFSLVFLCIQHCFVFFLVLTLYSLYPVQKFLMMSSHRDSHATHMKLTWVFNEFSCKLIWVSYDVFALMQLIWEIVGKKCMRFSWKTWGLHEKIFFILIFSYMRKIAKTHVLTVKKEFRIKKNKKFARNQDRTSNLCFTNPTC